MAADVVFESDEAELSADERIFVWRLSSHLRSIVDQNVHGDAFHGDGPEQPLVAMVSIGDPAASRHLVDLGVHFAADHVRGDRLHNQLYTLPGAPSPWALDETGDVQSLARRSAEWLAVQLRRPIVLYVWLHEDYAYAARYAFADRDETISQAYVERLAPPGQPERLIAEGHVRGKGWIQTTGLPDPTLYLHICGDLTRAALPVGVPEHTERGPLPGLWYA